MAGFEPATAANSGPMALHRDGTASDAAAWLPSSAAEKLRMLRQHATDLNRMCIPFDERHAAHNAKVEAEQRLKRLQARRPDGGFELPDDDLRVMQARQQLDTLAAEATRLNAHHELRSAAWTIAAQTLSAVEMWLRDGRPPNAALDDHNGPEPRLNKGEDVLACIERHRRRGRELKADLNRVRSAPFPSAHAKAQVRAQIDQLAARGAPSVSSVIEHDGTIEFPSERVSAMVMNAQPGAVAFHEVPDTLALFAWLHRDALVAALDREIDAEADDGAALDHVERQKRADEVQADLLAVERDEAALVWTALKQGLPVEHRIDVDPLALLGIVLVPAPRANGSAGSSAGMSWPWKR